VRASGGGDLLSETAWAGTVGSRMGAAAPEERGLLTEWVRFDGAWSFFAAPPTKSAAFLSRAYRIWSRGVAEPPVRGAAPRRICPRAGACVVHGPGTGRCPPEAASVGRRRAAGFPLVNGRGFHQRGVGCNVRVEQGRPRVVCA